MRRPPARLLIIAGSDSGGGAGVQADIKTATAFGVYAATAVTCVTAQDTVRIHALHRVPAFIVREQIACVLDDIGADAIKIGMLGSAEIVAAVADVLEEKARAIPLVLDPVLASTSGMPFLDREGIELLKSRLISLATLVTPNRTELEVLVPDSHPDRLLQLGASAVLLTGGDMPGDTVTDIYHDRGGLLRFQRPKIETRSTHGTGCTLATAIACGMAEGRSVPQAIEDARNYLQAAIEAAPGFGEGHGPLNHMHEFVRP